MYISAVLWISINALLVASQIPVQYQLKCRLCNNALELRDCTRQAVCDNRTEECYMDQVITETFTIVYRGGCRGKGQCRGGGGAISGKRDEVTACSQCCTTNDCNSLLCGIKHYNLMQSQCYFCDSAKSDQGAVTKPEDCITFTTCDLDQVCYAANVYHPASPMTFKYGCQNKFICKLVMRHVFEDLDSCILRHPIECQHESALCNICCGDGACNFGECDDIRMRLYLLYKKGLFDLDTLQTVGNSSSTTSSVGR